MINISKSNQTIDNKIRETILKTTKPIILILETPFNLLHDFADSVKNLLITNIRNKTLVKENLELKRLYLESLDILNENTNLKNLLNFKNNNSQQYNFTATKVYSIVKNNVANSFIINVGSADGIIEGSLVVGNKNSLIGRVINVMENYSNVLMLNDSNSKVPARTLETGEKIIVSGNNTSKTLKIIFFNSKKPNIKEDDLIYTSGDSNIVPDGVYIGKIIKKDGNYFVDMNENPYGVFNVLILTPKPKVDHIIKKLPASNNIKEIKTKIDNTRQQNINLESNAATLNEMETGLENNDIED